MCPKYVRKNARKLVANSGGEFAGEPGRGSGSKSGSKPGSKSGRKTGYDTSDVYGRRMPQWRKRWSAAFVLICSGVFATPVLAEGSDWVEARDGASFSTVNVDAGYVLGLDRFDLDEHTEILGWQITDSWYFGRQDGEDSGLTLVWQSDENQVSLSKDGVRLTKRF